MKIVVLGVDVFDGDFVVYKNIGRDILYVFGVEGRLEFGVYEVIIFVRVY